MCSLFVEPVTEIESHEIVNWLDANNARRPYDIRPQIVKENIDYNYQYKKTCLRVRAYVYL